MTPYSKLRLALAWWLFPCLVQAQESFTFGDYRLPIDLSLSLSGNYGEFRANHFHTGYDMRIGGVVGAKLYAVADGFIAKISVSPSGYGNALYIEHPNGTTSLYGHLLDFAPSIQAYVKEKQYDQQSFSVNLTCTPELFPVKKGDFVGRAGNSGSSGGPHLHFEVRNTETQATLNVCDYGLYPVTDHTPPKLNRLQFYGYSIQAGVPRTALLQAIDVAAPPKVVAVSDTFYVAMGAYDRMEGSNASLALSSYDVYIDDNKVYRYKKTDLPASMGRYLNSFLQYDQREKNNFSLLKTWVEPGNMVSGFVPLGQSGLFSLSDTLLHRLKIVLTDDSGNESVYQYTVARQASRKMPVYPVLGKVLVWAIDNYDEKEGMRLYLPFGALGKNIDFNVDCVEAPAISGRSFYAPLWRIGSPLEPLLKPMRLAIFAKVPEAFREKAVTVLLSENGRYSAAGGEWTGDFLETRTYQFGNYTVAIDTIPPFITPAYKTTDLRGAAQIGFRIADDLSGIKSYDGYIDGQWVLFEYDAKYSSLNYRFDKKRMVSGKQHELELKVTDYRNNVAVYHTSFTW